MEDASVRRVEEWAEAWKRKRPGDDAKRDEMFAWARAHGQMDECLDGLLRSQSFHDRPSPEDVALAERIGDEVFGGSS